MQSYLNNVNLSKYRIVLSRLRLSSHRLNVETGRWHKPNPIPFDERKCINCESLEDEYHFIIECQLYTVIRNLYIKKYYFTKPSMFKFIQLLTSQNVNEQRKLGMFIFKAFELRNTFYSYYNLITSIRFCTIDVVCDFDHFNLYYVCIYLYAHELHVRCI